MGPEENMLATLLLSPFIIFAVHMALSRWSRHTSRQLTAVKAAALGSVPVVLILGGFVFRDIHEPLEFMTAFLYCALVYCLLSISYFHFFNMSETARRIRILCELERAGSLSTRDMTALYKTTDIIRFRLDRLVAMRQLKCEAGWYSIDGKVLYWTGIAITLWRRVLGLDEGRE
jgi:hypothetical protein